jgi:hypothetical protein
MDRAGQTENIRKPGRIPATKQFFARTAQSAKMLKSQPVRRHRTHKANGDPKAAESAVTKIWGTRAISRSSAAE